MNIDEVLKEIPEFPGVYLMKNSKNEIIYIGKAKVLKNRVSSYFSGNTKDIKTQELVKRIENIEYIITQSEVDALLLENNLIKKNKPRYNILLKDQKTYPYIKITNEIFPKLEIIRNTKKLNKGQIFGPYTSGVKYIVKTIQRIFKIRDCKRDMSKLYNKPCLKYHMKMCLGPCIKKDIKEEYIENINLAKSLLNGKNSNIIEELEIKMKDCSEKMDFERAISYRDKIDAIKNLEKKQVAEYGKSIDEDLFLVREKNEKIFLFVLNIRNGRIIGQNFFQNKINKDFNDEEFLSIFFQYYNKYPIPKNIILESDYSKLENIIKEGINKLHNRNISLFFPKINSRRKEILEMGRKNLYDRIERYYLSKKIIQIGLNKLKSRLKLKRLPLRIECFDISNIQGKDAVGAMSVAIQGKAEKAEYRKYKIKTKDTPDDFHMMSEVLWRRYSKLEIENFPDLILIDGGKGQLGVAEKVLRETGKIDYLDIISIAKKEELVFKVGEDEPFFLKKNDEALKILQRLRDEAHRFGISYHRKLRSKRVQESQLDKIPGIGNVRKKALLKKFKTIKKIKEAEIKDLIEIVPEKVAENIKKNLKV